MNVLLTPPSIVMSFDFDLELTVFDLTQHTCMLRMYLVSGRTELVDNNFGGDDQEKCCVTKGTLSTKMG